MVFSQPALALPEPSPTQGQIFFVFMGFVLGKISALLFSVAVNLAQLALGKVLAALLLPVRSTFSTSVRLRGITTGASQPSEDFYVLEDARPWLLRGLVIFFALLTIHVWGTLTLKIQERSRRTRHQISELEAQIHGKPPPGSSLSGDDEAQMLLHYLIDGSFVLRLPVSFLLSLCAECAATEKSGLHPEQRDH
ncbi:hypothetical protein BDV96DRAFT_648199 [Lophiotrema nucula]|uniref:Uncharacterized protein n=1 Tax=Lophiotrema nucula TaxID=690887 RepID=A0A6A5Z2Y7_9PLEO|nr:hypothetical protein BDV96DRAFT_648199 [Lophiotrema nucula]